MYDTSELRSLSRDLAGAGDRAVRRTFTALDKGAHAIEAGGKSRAPVDTGNLRASISAEQVVATDEASEWHVGPTASYGVYVELGTSRMPPQAYMGPATDQVEPGLTAALERAIEEAL